MKIAVIGTGAYSLAIAYSLAKKNNDIYMWTHQESIVDEYKKNKKLKSIIDFKMASNIYVLNDLKEVMKDADIIYVGVASQFFKLIVNDMKKYYKKNTPICIATKGIDDTSKEFLSNIARNVLNTKTIAVLSGPTFAIDIINEEPVALALATKSTVTRELIKNTLPNNKLKLRYNTDLIGVQICGSVKNIIAIASGILNGMGYSNSTTAFLINEAMHDIKNTIYYLGGKKSTILSFAGIGDLILTCTSTKSRNFSFGYTIGKYNDSKKTEEYLNNTTVEGFYALLSIKALLKKHQIKIPLINIINDVVNNGKNPEKLVKFLIEKE